MSFSQLRFDHYARELSLAIYDLSLESRASPFHELKQDLRNVVEKGRRDPVQPVPNRKHFRHLDEKRQRRTMSDTEVTATTLPTVDIAPKPIDTAPSSNITGLLSGAFKDKLAEMRTKIADRQKQALAKIDGAVVTGAAKMEAAADDVARKVDQEISAALQEFAIHTNGGPA